MEGAERFSPQIDLNRFIHAQNPVYSTVIQELKNGRKRTHWMWFIFPQVDGLGFSETTRYYSIKSLEEGRQYLAHSLLGQRLVECTEAVMSLEGEAVTEIFPYPDDMKFLSCMTLFEKLAGSGSVFERVLQKYFTGKKDDRTLQILDNMKE